LKVTINNLSNNLSRKIVDLNDANCKLEAEIRKQKEAEEMRKLFVAGVSHELKTPISIIRGYMEGILDGFENGNINMEYAYIIQEETERMSQIVSDMLDLTQLESGKYELKSEEISLNRIMKYEIKKFAPMMKKKDIRIRFDLQQNQVTAKGDSNRIDQVLSNLLSNAVRYTPESGEIIIAIIDLKDAVRIEIENSCEDIPENELNNIWNDFYRIEKSHNKELGGTGLGLAVVKNILELHHSDYGVTKSLLGIKIYFSLPKYY
jgi:signal transduction histidine kinase